jgi:hypothetical protein
MGLAIRCVLEQSLSGIPWVEGKSLCTAYCAGLGGDVAANTADSSNIIAIDFGAGHSPLAAPPAAESLAAWLGPFMAGDRGVEWHEPGDGLAAVRALLGRLRAGAKIAAAPETLLDLEYDDDGEDLTDGVQRDLEDLEKVLVVAQVARCRFFLCFEG